MKKLHVNVSVNKNELEFLCNPEDTLLDVLRNDLQLTGTKEGCSTGDCGACSILISPVRGGKFKPANSCLLFKRKITG